jgi:hypothetical protein
LTAGPPFIAVGRPLKFTAVGGVRMRTNDLWPAIAAGGEIRPVTFDAGLQLAPGVSIVSIQSLVATVHSGTADASAQTRWQGSPAIVASPTTGAAAQAVTQNFGNVPGATVYLLQMKVTGSDGSKPWIETTITSYVPA